MSYVSAPLRSLTVRSDYCFDSVDFARGSARIVPVLMVSAPARSTSVAVWLILRKEEREKKSEKRGTRSPPYSSDLRRLEREQYDFFLSSGTDNLSRKGDASKLRSLPCCLNLLEPGLLALPPRACPSPSTAARPPEALSPVRRALFGDEFVVSAVVVLVFADAPQYKPISPPPAVHLHPPQFRSTWPQAWKVFNFPRTVAKEGNRTSRASL